MVDDDSRRVAEQASEALAQLAREHAPEAERHDVGKVTATAAEATEPTAATLAATFEHVRALVRVPHEPLPGVLYGVAFSPDGTRLATAITDGTARLWDIATGHELARLAHADQLRDVAFSPDGTLLATASNDQTARVWDIATGRQVACVNHEDIVLAVAFSPDGTRIATACRWTATVSDSTTGREFTRLTHKHGLTSVGWMSDVAFSPDGTRLATAIAWYNGNDANARVWDIDSRRELVRFARGALNAIAFSPEGTRIATGGDDHTARVSDVATGGELVRFAHEDRRPVTGVVFSPDGARLATASTDRTARVWDIASGRKLARLTHENSVWDVAFNPQGTQLATVSNVTKQIEVPKRGFLGRTRTEKMDRPYAYATVWGA